VKMKLNRTNADRELLRARLEEINMPSYERLIAQAHLERAEVLSDLIVAVARKVKAVTKLLVVRPVRRALDAMGG